MIADSLCRHERITIQQWGRWRWGATVTIGMLQWGEFGGPYAFTRKRCEKKARRALAKMRVARQTIHDRAS